MSPGATAHMLTLMTDATQMEIDGDLSVYIPNYTGILDKSNNAY
jgi:hypothetical protein